MPKKIKIMTISDMPFAPSGVGNVTNYLIRSMLRTGKFSFISLGGAMKHERMDPIQLEEFKEDWIIFPVQDYGDQDTVRSIIRNHRPDILWFVTDPRFFFWLFQIENEIRPLIPMIYYHVWDNTPIPYYNEPVYSSLDTIVSISKVTEGIVNAVSPQVEHYRIPHSVPSELFKKLPDDQVAKWRAEQMPWSNGKFLFFWNNRNARRKMSGTLVWWFKEFLDKVGHDKACLLMHTNPHDPMGQDLELIAHDLGLDKDGKFFISNQPVEHQILSLMYNAADCTINVSDAEGFGLCVAGNTKIITDRNVKEVKEVQVDDEVFGLDGKFHKVLKTANRKDKVISIKSVGNEKLELTQDHPVLCYSLNGELTTGKMFHVYNKLEKMGEGNIPFEWKKAKDVKKGDLLVVPRLKKTEDLPDEIDLLDWVSLGHFYEFNECFIWDKRKEHSIVKRKIKVDDKFLNFIGWYLAEGSCAKGKTLQMDFNQNEIEEVRVLQKNIKDIFGTDVRIIEHDQRETSCSIMKKSRIIGDFLEKFCGSGCRNKFINEVLMKDPSKLGSLLNGLFSGDGFIDKEKNKYHLSNTSIHLINQVKNILSHFGIYSSIRNKKNNQGFSNKDIYVLSIGVEHFDHFCKLTGLKNRETNKINERRRWIVKENFILVPVYSVSGLSDEEVDVYDLQIEDIKNFVANGVVVHNSTLESLMCETPILVNMTGGLQEQVTDGKEWFGIGIEPKAKAIIGSPETPYIYEDRITKEDFIEAMEKMMNASFSQRREWGRKGREHCDREYNFDHLMKKWETLFEEIYQKHGSWDTRKLQHKLWELKEI